MKYSNQNVFKALVKRPKFQANNNKQNDLVSISDTITIHFGGIQLRKFLVLLFLQDSKVLTHSSPKPIVTVSIAEKIKKNDVISLIDVSPSNSLSHHMIL